MVRPWPPFPDADRPRAGGDSGQSPGTPPPDCPHVVRTGLVPPGCLCTGKIVMFEAELVSVNCCQEILHTYQCVCVWCVCLCGVCVWCVWCVCVCGVCVCVFVCVCVCGVSVCGVCVWCVCVVCVCVVCVCVLSVCGASLSPILCLHSLTRTFYPLFSLCCPCVIPSVCTPSAHPLAPIPHLLSNSSVGLSRKPNVQQDVWRTSLKMCLTPHSDLEPSH